ncbi:MAG: beta-N-acetylglucosaminidase domain-containing protein [Candidatus Binatia bacterium]|jgi:hyaluronoglucosaminidase|nr:beta-N-acetylglucosaminidase domain-containing protein [Candidatus Binatia bacterium]|tara:strand:- start:15 stop:1175 length:1161 start_codon:yes stop_codon:yes gene_type:complete
MMLDPKTFQRRGIVEGFFGPLWSTAHRSALFEFGAARGMNTYLYAPKDDPYHRKKWREPYPEKEWKELTCLIHTAREFKIDFVYGFHPGLGLHFTDRDAVGCLLRKAQALYDSGVRTFAILFDDIPSRLEFPEDLKEFNGSLAQAEGIWVAKVLDQLPASWSGVEWWTCPSYYTDDSVLARSWGEFEPSFLETLGKHLPETVACFWTGPLVVSRTITLSHMHQVAGKIKRPLILWDNYPVNDLSMSMEMHIEPLTGREPQLPEGTYGYLNNPLLQESLSFIPLATCFDYAADPAGYDPEASWERAVEERFGPNSLVDWRALREFCNHINRSKDKNQPIKLLADRRPALEMAHRYILANRKERWVEEFTPWLNLLERSLALDLDPDS